MAKAIQKVDEANMAAFNALGEKDQERVRELMWSLERNMRRFLYMKSFKAFVLRALGMGFLKGYQDPGVLRVMDQFQEYLDDYLEKKEEAETRYQVIVCIPRRCMKSTTFTQAIHQWLHLRDTEYAGGTSSANYERMAKKFTRVCKSHWESRTSEFVDLFGPFNAVGNKWSDEEMITVKRRGSRGDPTLRPFSVEGSATSGHLDGFALDDPVTEAQVEKFKDSWWPKLYAHYNSLDFVVNPDGLLLLIGTRYGDMDLFGYIVENEIAPVVQEKLGELPEDFEEQWDKYANKHTDWHVILDAVHGEEDENGVQELRFPVIWPQKAIDQTRSRGATGESFYATQLQNRPADRRDNPVKKDHIKQWWTTLEDIPSEAFNNIVLCMDTAWKSQKAYIAQSGDWNVIQAWAQHQGHAYLFKQWHGRVTQQQFGNKFLWFLQAIESTYGKYPEVVSYDKPIGGHGSSSRDWFLRICHDKGMPCPPIVEIPRTNNKVSEILEIAGFIQDGRVHVVKGIMGEKELVHQATHIGFCKHDDHIDCLKDVFHPDLYRPPKKAKLSAKPSKIIPFESLFERPDDEDEYVVR